MFLQVPLLVEALDTEGTLEGSVPLVAASVGGQARPVLELLAALLAEEFRLRIVNIEVGVEVTSCLERFLALITVKGPLGAVSLEVSI